MKIDGLSTIEIKILKQFYTGKNWLYSSFSLEELSKKVDLNRSMLRYYLRKLARRNFIKEIKTYPRFWQSVKDESIRKKIRNRAEKLTRWFSDDA